MTDVLTLITTEAVGRALAEAREECKDDTRWLNAINRAALNLMAVKWQYDGEHLLVFRADGKAYYSVTRGGCACKAYEHGHPCWHRAARRLLERAAELADVPIPVEACPMCGRAIKPVAYTISGKSYLYYEVCSGDGIHLFDVK